MSCHNIIEYAEGRFPLFPVQKFVLKLMYGLPLDEPMMVNHAHPLGGSPVETTEEEYLRYLYLNGRCNLAEPPPPEHEFRETILVMGRRSGKTMLTDLITAWEARKVLDLPDSAEHFGMPPNSTTGALVLEASKEQAVLLSNEWQSGVRYDDLFKACFLRQNANKAEYRAGDSKVQISFDSPRPCRVRGLNLFLLTMEDWDHYQEPMNMLHAATPCLINSRYAEGFFGKMLITGPQSRPGSALKEYVEARRVMGREGRGDRPLILQIPTWEANSAIRMADFTFTRELDPEVFRMEYGAELL